MIQKKTSHLDFVNITLLQKMIWQIVCEFVPKVHSFGNLATCYCHLISTSYLAGTLRPNPASDGVAEASFDLNPPVSALMDVTPSGISETTVELLTEQRCQMHCKLQKRGLELKKSWPISTTQKRWHVYQLPSVLICKLYKCKILEMFVAQ